MRFQLTEQEKALLIAAEIEYSADREYTDDEALLILEQVRDIEVAHSQFTDEEGKRLYLEYGDIADKIHRSIPDLDS